MTKAAKKSTDHAQQNQRIVSSSHLVSEKSPELSEVEFGLIIFTHAFHRWMIRCMSAAGAKDMTPVDVMVMHHINHRDSEKRLADICFVLNIEDTHVVSYSLKKLAAAGLVEGSKRGKEVFFATTAAGRDLCMKYRAVREACRMLGQWDESAGLTEQKLFMPSERVCWCAIDPDRTPPPPF